MNNLRRAIWTREVKSEIESVWGNKHRRFAKVLVVGGGTLVLTKRLTAQFGMNNLRRAARELKKRWREWTSGALLFLVLVLLEQWLEHRP